jgi:hypothetical protein
MIGREPNPGPLLSKLLHDSGFRVRLSWQYKLVYFSKAPGPGSPLFFSCRS